jgi:4'-phosphopantetheinyl transferase EntD
MTPALGEVRRCGRYDAGTATTWRRRTVILMPDVPPSVAVAHVTDSETLPDLYPEELSIIADRAAPSRRNDFTRGRIAARRALEHLEVVDAPVLRGAHREPLWPEGIVGSITHAAGHALAAVGRHSEWGGIGLDLEHSDRYFDDLTAHVAFDDELTSIESLEGDPRIRATLETFSAKEAVYKALFPIVGEFFGFQAARIHRRPGGLVAEIVETLSPEVPAGSSWPMGCVWHDDLVLTSLVLPP